MNPIAKAYELYCSERFPLPIESQIRQIENRIGVVLPETYRQYLLKFNGGVFSEPSIPPRGDGCPEDSLLFMNGIGSNPEYGIELGSTKDLALFSDNDPVIVLPIGWTTMNNAILLLTDPEDCGVICLKKAFSNEYFHVGDSIDDFFRHLLDS